MDIMLIETVNKNKLQTLFFMFIAVVVFSAFLLVSNDKSHLPELVRAVAVMPSKNVNAVDLVDHNNNIINLEQFKKHWTFVFFGFTNCPDVCPATISQLIQVKNGIKKNNQFKDDFKIFFVSVDPKRDSLEHLKQYMTYFDSSFVGMTGSEESIRAFEEKLGAFHKLEAPNSDGGYSVQHTADVFLINDKGMLVAKFQPPMNTDRVVKQFFEFVSLQNQISG